MDIYFFTLGYDPTLLCVFVVQIILALAIKRSFKVTLVSTLPGKLT